MPVMTDDIHAASEAPIHDGHWLKSCRLVHPKGDKCLTVLGGRAMLARDEDYRVARFIAEDMYGDPRPHIRRGSKSGQAAYSRSGHYIACGRILV